MPLTQSGDLEAFRISTADSGPFSPDLAWARLALASGARGVPPGGGFTFQHLLCVWFLLGVPRPGAYLSFWEALAGSVRGSPEAWDLRSRACENPVGPIS